MISIFSIPKPFKGTAAVIQKNALASWKSLAARPEIILFGDDEGVAETAGQAAVRHESHVEKTPQGTPLLGFVFERTRQIASGATLVYVNADIILTDSVMAAAKIAEAVRAGDFVMIGRRTDMDIDGPMDFSDGWQEKLASEAARRGRLHGYSGIDYIIFPKTFNPEMPPFAVGRPGWDNWLIWKARSKRAPVIDATSDALAVHQNHDYSHSKFGGKKSVGGPETKTNYKLAGGFTRMLNILDADYLLKDGLLRRPDYPRKFFSDISLFYPWRAALAVKRTLYNFIYDAFRN